MSFILAFLSILLNSSLFHSQTLVKEMGNQFAKISYSYENVIAKPIVLPQEISAKAYLVQERNGRVLLKKNANQSFPIASLTKLFTTYTALKYIPESEVITLDQEAIAQEGIAGLFQVGERFLRDELVKASLILSSNDAAYALAKSFGVQNFVFLLNRTVNQFGLSKTHFIEPTGLLPGNVSSPVDILNFVFAIKSEFPQIWSWSKEREITLDGFQKREFYNVNIDTLKKYSNLILMQKTGFTDEAGKCLVIVVKLRNSPEIGIVLLNAPNREKDLEFIISALKKYYE